VSASPPLFFLTTTTTHLQLMQIGSLPILDKLCEHSNSTLELTHIINIITKSPDGNTSDTSGRCLIWISPETPILTEILQSFVQSFQTNAGTISQFRTQLPTLRSLPIHYPCVI
jgi:hypothetical protein